MRLLSYDEKFDEAIGSLDQLTLWTVKFHGDVMKETCRLAVEGEQLIGVAYLQKRGFYAIDTVELDYYEIILDYVIDWKRDDAILALGMLLTEMKGCCDEISKNYSGKRIFIKTWALEEEHDIIEFFLKQGFVIGRCTPVMVRNIVEDSSLAVKPQEMLQVHLGTETKNLEFKILNFDDKVMAEYLKSNGNAFFVPDSEKDLWFKLNSPDLKIFAATCGDQVIASVMIWRINEKRAATENIFCIDSYKRKGITSALIDYVCFYLKEQGYEEASLTVFQDNSPAFLLYEKKGYRFEKLNIGLQYETGYTARPY